MKSVLVIAALALPIPGAVAYAGSPCFGTCVQTKASCLAGAIAALKACKKTAHMNTSAGPSRRAAAAACVTTFVGAVQQCGSDFKTCVGDCMTPPPNGCQQGCREAEATCVQDALVSGGACVKACPRTSFFDHIGCVVACIKSTNDAIDRCKGDFKTCTGNCGSPSGAFLD